MTALPKMQQRLRVLNPETHKGNHGQTPCYKLVRQQDLYEDLTHYCQQKQKKGNHAYFDNKCKGNENFRTGNEIIDKVCHCAVCTAVCST